MKIAIVTPHPVPFAIGGAENLWWGLQDYFQAQTDHVCEIVALASPESSLPELVASYEAFFHLDLSGYDCVISGKYPAWMVDHPNHVCYMLHRLRGLYDTYKAPPLNVPLDNLTRWMRGFRGTFVERQTISEFFDRFRSMRLSDLPPETVAFPGPLAREIVHFLDNAALADHNISKYAAISKTVAERRDYFPAGVRPSILYPPPHRHDYRCGSSDYLFVPSRLDRPKRVDLLIKAMQHVTADIPLLIAGTGPESSRLSALAAGDKRIQFMGYVAEQDMPGLYADALAVPFVPYDEDYGLVTIEAMRSGKPVITCTDSGGPTEFVIDGKTGFVTAPDPIKIAEAIDALCRSPIHALELGARARQSVEQINWATVANGLIGTQQTTLLSASPRRPKLTVATSFPIWPPMGGGQARVFHLYKNLANRFDIEIISLGNSTGSQTETTIAPGLTEICVPKSAAHRKFEQELANQVGNIPVGDIAAYLLSGTTPAYRDALELSALDSHAVIACHPYLIDDIKAAAPDKPVWYEAQDVEYDLKRSLFNADADGKTLLEAVRQSESLCWRSAQHVFACAQRDLDRLNTLYGPTRAYLHEVPNGVALDEIRYLGPQKRRELKSRCGLGARATAIFIGSWHGPNLDAIEQIIAVAPTLTNVAFFIVGSAGIAFRTRALPANIHILGQVDATTRDSLFAVSDLALNPMRSGSGTNLKMLDYFASGIPVLSSQFGARGLDTEVGEHFMATNDDDLARNINDFFKRDAAEVDVMVKKARHLVEEHYGWDSIAANFAEALER